MVEAKDIIPIIVIGGLAYLALRGRAEEIEEIPPEEKPPMPSPPWPFPPILEPTIEEIVTPPPPPREVLPLPPLTPYPIEFLLPPPPREVLAPPPPEIILPPPVEIVLPPPPPPPQYVPPPAYPVEPTPIALEEFERALREYAREEWERVENALRQYGGYAVIFRVEPPPERLALFESMLLNININTRGMCVYGGGYRWYDYLGAYVYDVKASWSPAMREECKRRIRPAIEMAFSGYYSEVREY